MTAALSLGVASGAQLITNGSFESGNLNGWSVVDQANGSGSWLAYQNGTPLPFSTLSGIEFGTRPPQNGSGQYVATTDGFGNGSHVLYQMIVVPAGATSITIAFDYFLANQHSSYLTPNSLDFGVGPNQQARVDIMGTGWNPGADAFSLAAVFTNLFQTAAGTPLIMSAFQSLSVTIPISPGTYYLRFAEVDNQMIFNFAIDNVSVTTGDAPPPTGEIPEPSTWAMLGLGLGGLLFRGTRKSA
jgi:hypothetical protein